uniref:Uncharacterized protein n=1 Tax=Anguilla anguilla TaxID=7936 RepID=A0A0E9RH22_ANGAN
MVPVYILTKPAFNIKIMKIITLYGVMSLAILLQNDSTCFYDAE